MSIPPAPSPVTAAQAEERRLARLRMLSVLDTRPEPVFDMLVRVAATVCGTPIALMTLVDQDRQWFKANQGLEHVSETPRSMAFCDHTIRDDRVLEVRDATRDPRFEANPLVTGDPNIRFYAGAPIAMPGGERVGALCVIDRRPGGLSPQQEAALRDLAGVAQWALLQRERLLEVAILGDEARRTADALRAAEAEVRRAKEAAEAANRAKSDFLDNVSHEIRTPLNGVLGLTRLLLAEPLSPQQRKYVQLADASAGSLLELINDLLDLGKIESGRMEMEQEPFRLDELLQPLADLYRLRAQDKGLRFLVDLDARVPGVVLGDPTRLRQVLNNLLSNALKFTSRGEFGLIVGRAGAGRGPDMVRFTVWDTGIGIPQEAQQRLFTRFTQADPSTARNFGGTGLGLAIVKQLCEQMGGTVLLQSEPGRGASFRCELPLPAAPGTAAPRQSVVVHGQEPASHATRVLVAEDNPTNQVVIRGLLAQAGYRDVTVADDGEQALAAVARSEFDLVLMDCRMPRVDGYEASRRLRASGFTQPIIALTANAAAGERERCLAWGMNDYLTKPVDPVRLAQVLREWTRTAGPALQPVQTARAAAEPAGFDRTQALDRLGGDEELLSVALGSFREHAPRVLQSAEAALGAGAATDLHRHLHSLAGSAAMVGAEPLHRVARQLEGQAGEGRLEQVRSGLPALHGLLSRFIAESARW